MGLLHDDPFQLRDGYTIHPEQFRDSDAITKEEGLFLHALVRAIKPTIAVETGSHKGVSSSYIALALRENKLGHLYTCDPAEVLGAAENLRPLSDWVTYTPCKGIDLPIPGKIDFLFIDGYHEKEEVITEWNHFSPHLSDNAVVVFHDAHDPKDQTKLEDYVNGGIKALNLKTIIIPSENRFRLYFHGYDRTDQSSAS